MLISKTSFIYLKKKCAFTKLNDYIDNIFL